LNGHHASKVARPLFQRAFTEANQRLSARLRHAGSPMGAKPVVRLCAQPGRLLVFGGISKADKAGANAKQPRSIL